MHTAQQPNTEVTSATGAEAARDVEEGMVHFHAKRLDEALVAFQRALVLNPQAAPAYNGIGRVYYHLGPPERAIEAYRRAITIDPHYIDAYYGLAILYSAQLDKHATALATFQQGLEYNPNHAFLVACTGSTYARMGRFDESMAALQEAIRLQPDNAYAYSWISMIALHHKRYEEMIDACQREIDIADTHSPRRLLGYVYAHLARHDEAIAEFERALVLAPDDYEARAALARVYRTVGHLQEADTHYALAHAQAMADDEYGQACFAAVSGNVEEALTLLESALAKGQAQIGWMRIDPEFAFILDEPRFQALIKNAQ